MLSKEAIPYSFAVLFFPFFFFFLDLCNLGTEALSVKLLIRLSWKPSGMSLCLIFCLSVWPCIPLTSCLFPVGTLSLGLNALCLPAVTFVSLLYRLSYRQSVSLSDHFSCVCLTICLPSWPNVCHSAWPPAFLSVALSPQSVSLSVWLTIFMLPICLSQSHLVCLFCLTASIFTLDGTPTVSKHHFAHWTEKCKDDINTHR